MIKLIVGLGNPGQQYERTRHNVGFLFLDRLAEQFFGAWSKAPQFQALIAECRIGREKIILLKPQTYMNRSGHSVGQVARYYKFLPEQILVVHDELDFVPGLLRLKKGGGHAGHNGLKDIITHLNSNDFCRLRLGIGRPVVAGMAVADYVLSAPSKQENEMILSAILSGKEKIEAIVSGGCESAMNEINREK